MNKRAIVVLLLCHSGNLLAATGAEPLPEYTQHSFMMSVGWVAAVLSILGFIGLLTASAQKVDLHYGMGDVYLSVPIALAAWMGLGSLALMGWRGDDLLPFMQQKLWLSGGSFALALILSFVMVKRCNPQSGLVGVCIATFGRLFVDTLSQLFSILVVLSGLWVIFGGKKKDGREQVPFLGRLGCAVVFMWLFNLIWGSIRSTTRETVSSSNGYLLGILNILCIAGGVYGAYVYMHGTSTMDAAALVQAVQAQDADKARELIAENPMMDRTPAIEIALSNGCRNMLNIIVRQNSDLDHAINYAESRNMDSMLRFLKEKEYLTFPELEAATRGK